MSKYDPPKFNKEIAQQVEAELKAEYPKNKWTPGYIPDVIWSCCEGDTYFLGHHGAFDLYLEKLQLNRNICITCGLSFYSSEPDDFCSSSCELEYYD